MMQNSTRKWQLLSLALATLIAGAVYLLLTPSRNAATEQAVAPPAPFGPNNYNAMKTDTFVTLVQKAYGSLVSHQVQDDILLVELNHGNELTRDFFNGNEALLNYKLSDHGFELQYSAADKSLKARFRISKQGGINVPNDVLIKLMDKTTPINHVDKQQ